MHEIFDQFLIARENATKPIVWGEPTKFVLILFPWLGTFFPPGSNPMVYFHHMGNKWVFHQFPTAWENAVKSHQMGKSWESVTCIFPVVWVLFTISFPSCGILHHMENARISPSISYSTRKSNKIFRVNRT